MPSDYLRFGLVCVCCRNSKDKPCWRGKLNPTDLSNSSGCHNHSPSPTRCGEETIHERGSSIQASSPKAESPDPDLLRIPLSTRICSRQELEHKNAIGYRKSTETYKFEYYMDRLHTRDEEGKKSNRKWCIRLV